MGDGVDPSRISYVQSPMCLCLCVESVKTAVRVVEVVIIWIRPVRFTSVPHLSQQHDSHRFGHVHGGCVGYVEASAFSLRGAGRAAFKDDKDPCRRQGRQKLLLQGHANSSRIGPADWGDSCPKCLLCRPARARVSHPLILQPPNPPEAALESNHEPAVDYVSLLPESFFVTGDIKLFSFIDAHIRVAQGPVLRDIPTRNS